MRFLMLCPVLLVFLTPDPRGVIPPSFDPATIREAVDAAVDGESLVGFPNRHEDEAIDSAKTITVESLFITSGSLGGRGRIGNRKDWFFEIDSETEWNAGTFLGTETDGNGILRLEEDVTLYGDGSDGDVVIGTNTELTRDMNYRDLTVSMGATLDTAGYTIRVSGILTNLGTITDSRSGGAGGAGGSGGDGGYEGGAPQPGQSGDPGTSPSIAQAGWGGGGGNGGGGGGGAWDTYFNEEVEGGRGGAGGQGGPGGGYVKILVHTLNNAGIIHANGGAGSGGKNGDEGQYVQYQEFFPWQDDRDMAGGGGGGGAGGSGGDGGTVDITYGYLINSGACEAETGAVGSGGSGGNGIDTVEPAGNYQVETNGADGGSGPNPGGTGGRSEIENLYSDGGTPGNQGAAGLAGTVSVIRSNLFTLHGVYESVILDPGETVNWTYALVDTTQPSGTSVLVEYGEDESGTWQWYANLGDVPDSKRLKVRITLDTTDASITPTVDKVLVAYYSYVNNPPFTPGYAEPAHGAVRVVNHPLLTWVGGDPDTGDTVDYDIYFGPVNPPSLVASQQTSRMYDPGILDPGATYYWKVVARDGVGATAESPVFIFTTEPDLKMDVDTKTQWDEGQYGDTHADAQGDLLLAGDPSLYGDGTDGDQTITQYTLLSRDMNFRDLTVSAGAILDTAGYTVRVSGMLNNAGTITDTVSGGNGGSGGDEGQGGFGCYSHNQPTQGETGKAGGAPSVSPAGRGGDGGCGGNGGGGAWDDTYDEDAFGGDGGAGGRGGAGGGYVVLFAFDLNNQGVIHADGEPGDAAEDGQVGAYREYGTFPFLDLDMAGGGGGGGVGGHGGDGGTVEITYAYLTSLGAVRADGGAAGDPGDGGSGLNTYESKAVTQEDEYGASGGPGGNGGFSEAGSGGSAPGNMGLPGSSGMAGTVTLIPSIRHASSGQYLSKAFDAGEVVDWKTTSLNATIPTGTGVIVEFGEEISGTWIWYPYLEDIPDSRRLKLRITLSTTDLALTPSVDRITVTYGTDHVLRVPGDHANIQDALNAASLGNTIRVAPGTYHENLDFLGKAVTLCSEEGAHATVIDGGQAGPVVTFGCGEGLDSVLEGFTLTNGKGSAQSGGGIFCDASSPKIVSNRVIDNTTDGSGGGVSCLDHASPLLVNNVIVNNAALVAGGGIHCGPRGCSPLIVNNTLYGNTAGQWGGGIQSASPVIIANTILWGDSAPSGDELYVGHLFESPCVVFVKHSDVDGGPAAAGAEPGCLLCWETATMISVDPLFVNQGGGDYSLMYLSPCLDLGNNAFLPVDVILDHGGDPRRVQGLPPGNGMMIVPVGSSGSARIADMGADEFCAVKKQKL